MATRWAWLAMVMVACHTAEGPPPSRALEPSHASSADAATRTGEFRPCTTFSLGRAARWRYRTTWSYWPAFAGFPARSAEIGAALEPTSEKGTERDELLLTWLTDRWAGAKKAQPHIDHDIGIGEPARPVDAGDGFSTVPFHIEHIAEVKEGERWHDRHIVASGDVTSQGSRILSVHATYSLQDRPASQKVDWSQIPKKDGTFTAVADCAAQ